jgi:phosphoadenosine phosphosulfate reductase
MTRDEEGRGLANAALVDAASPSEGGRGWSRERASALSRRFESVEPRAVLEHFVGVFAADPEHPLKLASSLGAEDQVLTHMLLELDPDARIFALDTGRLHQQTYDLMSRMMTRYGFRYEVYAPQAEAVQEMVGEHGPNLFYASVENRKMCCHVRKVEPLQRALRQAGGWVTGLRRSQSAGRAETPVVDWDGTHQMVKVNPLASWSEEQVWDYLRSHEVPHNPLHDLGFPSIGCEPCTQAVAEGDDPRSGRWWWENDAAKECGLHTDVAGT